MFIWLLSKSPRYLGQSLYFTFRYCICVTGEKITEKDIIKLQSGGTGYSAHDKDKVRTKKYFHLGPGSGLTDLRGQH